MSDIHEVTTNDIRKRCGVFSLTSDLIDRPELLPDLLAVFGKVIPTRVEYMWHLLEFEVQFVSPEVPPVPDGQIPPRYMVRIDTVDDDGQPIEPRRITFVPAKPDVTHVASLQAATWMVKP